MSRYILDSSALLAWIYREPGADIVDRLMDQAVLSAVNLCEAISVMVRDGLPYAEAKSTLLETIPTVITFDQDLALRSALMIAETRLYGLSLGDCACLATAEHLKLEAVTADKMWTKLKSSIKIKVIR